MVRMIGLKFSLNKRELVPPQVRWKSIEDPKSFLKRKSYKEHRLVVEPTRNCSLDDFGIEKDGYVLTDAFAQERKDPHSGKPRFTVIFWFCKKEFAEISREFVQKVEDVMDAFDDLCTTAFWQLQIYANPFFLNNVEVSGQQSISIDLNERVPRFEPNGIPLKRWKKGDGGERVGDGPVPIWPDHLLSVSGNDIQFVPAE